MDDKTLRRILIQNCIFWMAVVDRKLEFNDVTYQLLRDDMVRIKELLERTSPENK